MYDPYDRLLTSPDSPSMHIHTTASLTYNNSSAFHVVTFFSGNCDSTFLLVIPQLSQHILSPACNSGVLFIQCIIIIVSVCLSLSPLKLECFTYLCMSFYIIKAPDFVSQQHFCNLSLTSLLPLCGCFFSFLNIYIITWSGL